MPGGHEMSFLLQARCLHSLHYNWSDKLLWEIHCVHKSNGSCGKTVWVNTQAPSALTQVSIYLVFSEPVLLCFFYWTAFISLLMHLFFLYSSDSGRNKQAEGFSRNWRGKKTWRCVQQRLFWKRKGWICWFVLKVYF